MSQPDLIDRLRETQLAAPPELRERVRLISAQAPVATRPRVTWRRSLVVLVPVAAAIIAGIALLPRDSKQGVQAERAIDTSPPSLSAAAGAAPAGAPILDYAATQRKTISPSATRIQKYSASLDLELRTPAAVADAARRAVAIATSLSGYQQTVTLRTATKTGYAHLVLRVPKGNVREAIRRLSALGTVTAENVSIADLEVQVNATDQRIARFRAQLAALQARPQTTELQHQIVALTAQIERLQRARAATVRSAHYATVELQLSTPGAAIPVQHKRNPLHGLGVAFHWAWIGAIYVLALGTPLLALVAALWLGTRGVRRRREEALLRWT